MNQFITFSEKFFSKYRGKQPNWGFGGLGYITYKRSYARRTDNDTRTEEWWETVRRCIEGAQEIGANYTIEEAEKLYDHIFNLRCTFPGRGLWQLGTDTVRKFGANSLINCYSTNIQNINDFLFLFENLMLGGGVGFSIRKEHVYEFPKVKENIKIIHKSTKDADFIIPDSREGWVKILKKVFESYFITGESFSYSSILVRGKGELIKTFGGIAAGPQVLVDGISEICKILDNRSGKKIRPIDALDVCNLISQIVISGNVRRSATIAIGDADDVLYLKAKRWDTGKIPNWRAMSNNTIDCDYFDHIQPLFWQGYKGNGEPYGLFNLRNCRRYGRTGENIPDNSIYNINPCGELPLADKETCCLSEIFMNNIGDVDTFWECARLLYKYQKAVCNMRYIHKETEDIVHKNNKIGVSVTGILQNKKAIDENWYDQVYKKLKKFDEGYSKNMGWPKSIRLTTVKPSGSVSLLAGATPGIHPAYSEYYIRRIEMSSNDQLVDYCRDLGYNVVYRKNYDGTDDRLTVKIEIPCFVGKDTPTSQSLSAIQLLDYVKFIQKNWADNAVSVTCYYNKKELPEVKKWLKKNYNEHIKSVSFLLHSNHGFVQPPYEPITEEKYKELASNIKKITAVDQDTYAQDVTSDCDTGACPIR